MRRTQLRHRTPLRRRARHTQANTGRERWDRARGHFCSVPGCRAFRNLDRHHVVLAQHVRAEGGDVWDPRNGMDLCRDCHAMHHAGAVRIPADLIPDAALAFAVDLFGSDLRAAAYIARYYAPARGRS